MASSDVLPTFRQARGKKEHGTATVGLTAVVLQAADDDLLSLLIYNVGPGQLYSGTSAVTTANTTPIKVGGNKTYERSSDATYIIADQAGTVVLWEREVEV